MMYFHFAVSVCLFVFTCGHQHQPYQPPAQPAYQQQVPHAHQQPIGHHPTQAGQVQPNMLRDKTHVQDKE